MMKEAKYYKTNNDNKVQCFLCPHNCIINENDRGKCDVRKNNGGILYSENYSVISAIHTDPIEKKPLYHYHPGKDILSIGSIGCNFKCKHCQNSNISQANINDYHNHKSISSEIIVNEAKRIRNNIGIAYTYNEPTVWFEFMTETAMLAKKEGLKNIVVTNGYINQDPLNELSDYIDAFNIDLKAYTDEFYIKQTESTLDPVLKTIETVFKLKKHFEVTTLIIPELNDNEEIFEDMIKMLRYNFGKDLVLHLSKYHPAYKTKIDATSKKTMINLYKIAKHHLNYVYLGNLITEKGQNTYCPNCNNLLISRNRYFTRISNFKDNKCSNCNTYIPIYS